MGYLRIDKTRVNQLDRSLYVQMLTGLTQLYLELELSLTDAILAAESDLVTWLRPNHRPTDRDPKSSVSISRKGYQSDDGSKLTNLAPNLPHH